MWSVCGQQHDVPDELIDFVVGWRAELAAYALEYIAGSTVTFRVWVSSSRYRPDLGST
jgi:hypothetical protein